MTSAQIMILLVDIGVVLALARAVGALFTRLGQSAVVGEILAGILLGPTLLPASISGVLFPASVRPVLSGLGNLGVLLFMFLVGLEFNGSLLRREVRTVVVVALAGMLVPFGLGVLFAIVSPDVGASRHGIGVALFMGTAMSVTAFPVLARMIVDRGLAGTKVAGMALGAAAIGDVVGWSMLAVAIATASGVAQWRAMLAVPLLAVLYFVLRGVLAWWARWRADRAGTGGPFVIILVGLCGFGALTEWLGLHFIFGAFLFGLSIPRAAAGGLADTARQVGQLGTRMLQPLYFVVAGLQVDLSHLGRTGLAEFGLIMLVAVGGKTIGVLGGALLSRTGARQAALLGTLMNARGLTELIILTTGLQLGLLGRDLYSLMVLMAVVTTAAAGPLVRLFASRMPNVETPEVPAPQLTT